MGRSWRSVCQSNEGRIDQVGSPTEIYRHPQSQFVADFIGRANFITGVVKAQRDGRLDVDFLGHSMTVPAAEAHYEGDGGAEGTRFRHRSFGVPTRPSPHESEGDHALDPRSPESQ